MSSGAACSDTDPRTNFSEDMLATLQMPIIAGDKIVGRRLPEAYSPAEKMFGAYDARNDNCMGLRGEV